MADIVLTETSPLEGTSLTIAGCTLRERPEIALTSLDCPLGGDSAFDAMLRERFAVSRPEPTRSNVTGNIRAVSLSPDQVLLMHPVDFEIEEGDAAYATEQTGSWCVIELSGERAQNALRRVCPIDLHESTFPAGASARTVMEHMGAIVIRTGDTSFLLLSASSSALSFWHALEQSLANISG